jgi:hypothetical protein
MPESTSPKKSHLIVTQFAMIFILCHMFSPVSAALTLPGAQKKVYRYPKGSGKPFFVSLNFSGRSKGTRQLICRK